MKNEISKLYGLNNLKTFINFIHTIKFIRNICAHSGVIYDINFPKGIYKIPRTRFNNNNNQSLDAGIKTISFILKNISEERCNDIDLLTWDNFEAFKSWVQFWPNVALSMGFTSYEVDEFYRVLIEEDRNQINN